MRSRSKASSSTRDWALERYKMAIFAMGDAGFQSAFDGFDHVARFVMFVERGIQIDGFAFAAVSPQLFAHAPGVVGNQGIGSFEDARRGAVILLQTNGLCIREVG